jgi:RNA polymerase-binding transcription factor DksA
MMNRAVEFTHLNRFGEVHERLARRREELTERERRVRRDLARTNDPLVADFADQAIQTQNDEPLQVIGAAARAELAQIDAALARLAAGTYETCAICGEMIGATRLAVVPYANTCTDCALDAED